MQTDHENRRFGAIEAGGTKTVCAIADGTGRILAKAKLPTEHPDKTLSSVRDFFNSNLDRGRSLTRIGVAAFGPVDIDPASDSYGSILKTPKPDWTGASFVDALSSFDAPVVVDTDVNGAGLGEWLHGAGRGARTLAYVTVGTGIGVGVLHDGRSLAGFGHYEMGHIRPPHDLARDPFPGRCPFHGDCIEGLACGPAIIDRWGAPLNEIADPVLYKNAVDLEAEYLSFLASVIVLTHMADRIVFGGGVMKADGLIQALREKTKTAIGGYVQSGAFESDLSDYIVSPGLGDDAGITGAIALALAEV